jgi:outer membrane protein assembly factor BamB
LYWQIFHGIIVIMNIRYALYLSLLVTLKVLAFTATCDFVFAESSSVPSLWTRSKGEDWPRMLGTNSDSRSPETGILTDWSNSKLAIRWSRSTGIGYSNAVVSHGRLFQFDRFGNRERLSCLNAETGAELWQWESAVEYEDMYGYNKGPRSSPVVDHDRVYVYGVAGSFACIDVVQGRELWKTNLSEKFGVVQNFFGVGSSPCVFEDKILVLVGGSPEKSKMVPAGRLHFVEPNGSAIVAFNKQTGAELYRVGNYLASYSAPIIATIQGQPWCVTFVREGLFVFDPRDGSNEAFFPWRASILESVNAAWPIVDGNRIFVSETYEKGAACVEFDGKQLKPVWVDSKQRRNQAMRAHWATPILDNGFLFGCSGRNEPDADLRCVRLDDATVKWTHRNRDRTTGLWVDGHIVLLGEHGLLQLIRINTEKFEPITELDLGAMNAPDDQPWLESPSWAPPVLAHGLLYLRGKNRLVCLELIPD